MTRRTFLTSLVAVPVVLSLPRGLDAVGFSTYPPVRIEFRSGSRLIASRDIYLRQGLFVEATIDLTRTEVSRIRDWDTLTITLKHWPPCAVSDIELTAPPPEKPS